MTASIQCMTQCMTHRIIHSRMRPVNGHSKPFGGACCVRVASRATMVQARSPWASDSTRIKSSLSQRDKKREVDSMAEVDGS